MTPSKCYRNWIYACLFVGMAIPGAYGAANDWPEFRGPGKQGISAAVNVPITWSATSNIQWKVEIPGRGWSSPVVSKGRVYLTTAVSGSEGSPVSLRALCLDASNGALLWNSEVLEPDPSAAKAMHQKNSQASATPILQGERLYVHFGHMGTACLDLSGKVLWRQTTLKYSPLHGNGGSPELTGGLLVFSCDGLSDPFVVALDAADGTIKWKTPRNTAASRTFSFCTPLTITVEGKPQIILPGSGFVAAYDPVDGREIWRARYGEGYSVVPRPVFAHGMLYIATGFDRANIITVKPTGAQGDVTDKNIVWTYRKSVPTTPSLLVVGDELYFVSDGGVATCLDAHSGDLRWSERLGGDFSASPVYAEGRIYFQNEFGVGTVIKAGKSFEVLAKNDLGERSLASYAVMDGTLFIRSEAHLWKVGKGKAQ